jgi:hypothetical protein
MRRTFSIRPSRALADLADVLLDHVVVVEQPLTGRAHVGLAVTVRVGIADGGEAPVGVFQDLPGVVEPGEERSPPDRPFDRQLLARRQFLGPLGQVLGPQKLASDGAGEAVLAGIRADEGHDEGERAAKLRRFYWSDGRSLGWGTVSGPGTKNRFTVWYRGSIRWEGSGWEARVVFC